jgi:acetyl-CoA carboxylase biotin carboxyl carrier protein
MEISYIKKIIKLVEHSDVDEVEIEEEGKRIRVVKSKNSQLTTYQVPMAQPHFFQPVASPHPPVASQPTPEALQSPPPAKAEASFHEIRSPIVGTFYRAPAPDAASYVEVGQIIKPGQVMCIVEAMKLMNEIESDVEGRVVKIIVDNGKPVEYNQVLFLVEPA